MTLRRSPRLSAKTSFDTFADVTFCGALYGSKDSKLTEMYCSKIYDNLKHTLPKRYPKANYCVLVDHTTSANFIELASKLNHVRLVYLKHNRPDTILTFRLLLVSSIPQKRKYCCILDLHDEYDTRLTISHFAMVNRFVTRNQGECMAAGFWQTRYGTYSVDGGSICFRIKGENKFDVSIIIKAIREYVKTNLLRYFNKEPGGSDEHISNNIWCEVDDRFKLVFRSGNPTNMSLEGIQILDTIPYGKKNTMNLECIDITDYNIATEDDFSDKPRFIL